MMKLTTKLIGLADASSHQWLFAKLTTLNKRAESALKGGASSFQVQRFLGRLLTNFSHIVTLM